MRLVACGVGVSRQAGHGCHRLAKIAADSAGIEKHVFERRTQDAQNVGGFVWKKGLQAMAYGGCRCFQKGCDQPTDDVD